MEVLFRLGGLSVALAIIFQASMVKQQYTIFNTQLNSQVEEICQIT